MFGSACNAFSVLQCHALLQNVLVRQQPHAAEPSTPRRLSNSIRFHPAHLFVSLIHLLTSIALVFVCCASLFLPLFPFSPRSFRRGGGQRGARPQARPRGRLQAERSHLQLTQSNTTRRHTSISPTHLAFPPSHHHSFIASPSAFFQLRASFAASDARTLFRFARTFA